MKRHVIYSPEKTHMDILYRWAKRGRGVSYMGPNHVQINWNHTKVNRKHKPSISKPVLWLANGWCDGSDHPIRSLITNWLNFVLTILFHITVITESTFLFYVYINYYKSVYYTYSKDYFVRQMIQITGVSWKIKHLVECATIRLETNLVRFGGSFGFLRFGRFEVRFLGVK